MSVVEAKADEAQRHVASVCFHSISLQSCPWRVRDTYADADVESMAADIERAGRIVTPLLLTPAPASSPFAYLIVDGGLRLLGFASCCARGVRLQETAIAAEVLTEAPLALLRTALAAEPGLPRRPLEIAWAVERYAEMTRAAGVHMTQEELGQAVNVRHKSTVSSSLRFAQALPRETIDRLAKEHDVCPEVLIDRIRRQALRVLIEDWTDEQRAQLISAAVAAAASGRSVPAAVKRVASALAPQQQQPNANWWSRCVQLLDHVIARVRALIGIAFLRGMREPLS